MVITTHATHTHTTHTHTTHTHTHTTHTTHTHTHTFTHTHTIVLLKIGALMWGLYLYPRNVFDTFVIAITFSSYLCAGNFVLWYCLFCVLSSDMLNVTICTFVFEDISSKTMSLKNLKLQLITVISCPCVVNKATDLVCKFPKPTDVICTN